MRSTLLFMVNCFLAVLCCLLGSRTAMAWEGPVDDPSFPTITTGSNNTLTITGGRTSGVKWLMNVGSTINKSPIFTKNTFTINDVISTTSFYAMGTINNTTPLTTLNINNNSFYVNGGSYNIMRLIENDTRQLDNINNNSAYFGGKITVSNTLLVFDSMKQTGTSNLSNNYVEISGGNFQQVIANNSYGGSSTNNTFVITGGNFFGLVSPAKTTTNAVKDNLLKISGGRFFSIDEMNTDIAGGVVGKESVGETGGTATHNTVEISGAANVSGIRIFGGGYTETTNGSSTLKEEIVEKRLMEGNKLIINNWRGSAKNIYNLEFIDIYAKNDVANGTVILDLTDPKNKTLLGSTDGLKTTVNLSYIEAGAKLNADDRIHLLHNNNGFEGIARNNQEVKQGVSLIYEGRIDQTLNSVDFLITGVRATEESSSIPEGRLPGLALINAGSDLLGRFLDREYLVGKHVFGIASGGRMNYQTDTSSSFSMNNLNIITGANYTWEAGKDMMQAGAFFEAGWGDADLSTDTSNGSIDGRGDVHYYGGGISARYEKRDGFLKGLHFDASARTGMLSTKYKTDDLRLQETNETANYDINSAYHALHGGIGYRIPLSDTLNLDLLGRYFWTRISGADLTVLGDTYNLDELTSNKIRASATLNYTGDENISPYIKLGYDYEFNGTASGTVQDVRIRDTSMQGATGIAEFGCLTRPDWNKNLSIDASAALYGGRQTGVMGNVRVIYEF